MEGAVNAALLHVIGEGIDCGAVAVDGAAVVVHNAAVGINDAAVIIDGAAVGIDDAAVVVHQGAVVVHGAAVIVHGFSLQRVADLVCLVYQRRVLVLVLFGGRRVRILFGGQLLILRDGRLGLVRGLGLLLILLAVCRIGQGSGRQQAQQQSQHQQDREPFADLHGNTPFKSGSFIILYYIASVPACKATKR